MEGVHNLHSDISADSPGGLTEELDGQVECVEAGCGAQIPLPKCCEALVVIEDYALVGKMPEGKCIYEMGPRVENAVMCRLFPFTLSFMDNDSNIFCVIFAYLKLLLLKH